MSLDRSMHDGRRVDERPGPFDIEREDVVLARVVDDSVPIQSQAAPVEPAPTMVQPAASPRGPWAQSASQADAGEPEGAAPESYEGQYPGQVEGFAEQLPATVRPLRPDGPEWAAGAAGARRRRFPAFTMTRRGFEPAEVEMYLAQQEDALAASVERADTAERQLAEALTQLGTARQELAALQDERRSEPPASIQALGTRVADILDTAWRAAEELRAEAAGAADEARAAAAEVVRAAEEEARSRAADIVAEADRHRRVVLEELASRRAEHDADVARLTSERQSALDELQRLHRMIQQVLGPLQADAPVADAPVAGAPVADAPVAGPPADETSVADRSEPPVADGIAGAGERPTGDWSGQLARSGAEAAAAGDPAAGSPGMGAGGQGPADATEPTDGPGSWSQAFSWGAGPSASGDSDTPG